MNFLPFGNLPAFEPRRFVPAHADLGDWAALAPLFDDLEKRAGQCRTVAELETWLLQWSELTAALDEEGARRYIAMTCHTDEPAAKQAYLDFIEKIEPQLKPRQFRLSELLLKHPQRASLAPERYGVFDRDNAVTVELFREANVPIETREAMLSQKYQELTGGMTVQFRGAEKTLQQMAPFYEEPDRAVRQEAWELVVNRRLQDSEQLDTIFESLLGCRDEIASNAGFTNYRDFAWRKMRRFDYSPAQCVQFHEAIEQEIMPLAMELQERRRSLLKVPTLRPWDLEVDPLNRPPLRPFNDVEGMLQGTQRIFEAIDGDFSREFNRMRDMRLLDLDSRKGKAPGGYQSTLNEARVPFIFMHAVGVQRDVDTMLHEFGHAYHALASRHDPLVSYRSAPIEFCEVASMSMELLGADFIGEFYPPADAARARRKTLEAIIGFFPWMATVDGFQHWLYTHPGHTRDERKEAWLAIARRFGGIVDWSGFDQARANLWHRQLHIYQYPFYYVEYGIAQLGALQVWANWRRDRPSALQAYKSGLALGGARPLPELFTAAGCRFDFSAGSLRPLMQLVRKEWELLRD
ncbi:MAG: oligoendopeptidase [Verrucomicrobiota bacterium]|jgi:oligoendopeptidase F